MFLEITKKIGPVGEFTGLFLLEAFPAYAYSKLCESIPGMLVKDDEGKGEGG